MNLHLLSDLSHFNPELLSLMPARTHAVISRSVGNLSIICAAGLEGPEQKLAVMVQKLGGDSGGVGDDHAHRISKWCALVTLVTTF